MKAMISDRSKFEKLDIQKEKHLNFILNKEKRLTEICPTGSKPGVLYGQAEVCKSMEDNCPSFCLILSFLF